MLEFKNINVYDLKESVIAARNAMRLEMPEYTDEEFEKSLERCKKLVGASSNSKHVKCHDNFLTGIRVSFDMKYTQYITKQFQRYHWFDYVSSSSLMHRITRMDFSKCCNKFVSQATVDKMNGLVALYNKAAETKQETETFRLRDGEVIEAKTHADVLYYIFMIIISEAPMGTELFVRVSTNYKQLQTIYHQRKNHKLKDDYKAFIEMIDNLPYSKYFIKCEADNDNT